jgi:hypothetical protein
MKRLAAREGVSPITPKHNVFTDLTPQPDQGVGRSCLCMLAATIRYCKEWSKKEGCTNSFSPRKNLKMIDTSPQTGVFLAPDQQALHDILIF